jgi:hypothetical protein
MSPRLKSSHLWTNFPEEYTDIVLDLFHKEFAAPLKDAEFFFDGRIYGEEIILQIGYLPKKQLTQHNFKLSVDYNSQKENVLDKIHSCVDCIASIISEYLREESDLPRDWQPITFDKQIMYFLYHTENTRLEKEADRILQELQDDALVKESPKSEDLLDKVSDVIGTSTDTDLDSINNEDDDLASPTLFSTKKPSSMH